MLAFATIFLGIGMAVTPDSETKLASPEDTVIQKLYWHRLGDHVTVVLERDCAPKPSLRG